MRSGALFSSLLISTTVSGIAVAEAPASGPAPTPVTLPEDAETAPASSAPSKDGAGAPAAPAAPGSGPASSAAAPPSGAQPPQVQSAQSGPPIAPAVVFAPAAMPPGSASNSPGPDSGARKPEAPAKSRFNVGVNVDTVWYTGRSFDFFSDQNNVTSPGVSVGYAIWMDDPVSIVPELGWSTHTATANNLFGGAIERTELREHNGYAGLSLRYGILSFLEAHARFAAGMSFLRASVQPGGGVPKLGDNGLSPFGSLGAGFNVHSPAGALETRSGSLRSVIAGLTFEGGYQLGGAVDLTPAPDGDVGRVATQYASLGSLERSGPYFRTSLVVRF
jgi:hypothetical protein